MAYIEECFQDGSYNFFLLHCVYIFIVNENMRDAYRETAHSRYRGYMYVSFFLFNFM
jgi:hypothetical protein